MNEFNALKGSGWQRPQQDLSELDFMRLYMNKPPSLQEELAELCSNTPWSIEELKEAMRWALTRTTIAYKDLVLAASTHALERAIELKRSVMLVRIPFHPLQKQDRQLEYLHACALLP